MYAKHFAWLRNSHLLAAIAGTLAIGGFTAYVIRQNYQISLDRWNAELSASVRYQNWMLRNSLQQSQDDVQMLANYPATRRLLLSGNEKVPDAEIAALRRQVLSRFEEYRNIYEYDALYLIDPRGRIAVRAADGGAGDTAVGSPEFKDSLQSAVQSRKFVIHLAPDFQNELTLIFMSPVLAGNVEDRPGSLLGMVVTVDPFSRDLLPLLAAKRVGTRTGETVMLRLSASGARYTTAAARRTEPKDTLRGAVSSAAEARASFGQFVDYRGVSVLAAMQKIASIDSVLVCKVDRSEALADFRRVVRIETVAAVSILLAYLGLIMIHSRNASARAVREGLERQQFVNQILETTVAERTRQLAESNRQLHDELLERQKAEEEVRRFNVELDQRVNERTAELEIANKELEAFSYSVSHDLRAPLRRMRGFSTILIEEHAPQLTEEARELLDVVSKNAVQMGELIDCLLAFSHLGRQHLRKQPVVVSDIVYAAWQELTGERENRRVQLSVEDLGMCQADPLLLKQVFVNLLSNALKYSRTRPVARIDVGLTPLPAYSVRDNGVGFDMRYRDQLFGVFKRLHRAQDYEGIGIGLAFVERIVQRHGGRIWADSVVNEGANFFFTLSEPVARLEPVLEPRV